VWQWRSVAVAQWQWRSVALWCSGAVWQWRSGSGAVWHCGAVAQCGSDAVWQWWQCDSDTVAVAQCGSTMAGSGTAAVTMAGSGHSGSDGGWQWHCGSDSGWQWHCGSTFAGSCPKRCWQRIFFSHGQRTQCLYIKNLRKQKKRPRHVYEKKKLHRKARPNKNFNLTMIRFNFFLSENSKFPEIPKLHFFFFFFFFFFFLSA
jgi:hypothetical protein